MPATGPSVQKTKDYFMRLGMAYEMAVEEEGDLARQASDYLRDCDTPQNRYIPFRNSAQDDFRERAQLVPKAKTRYFDQYRAANQALQAMDLDEAGMVLPIHEISKSLETMQLCQEKLAALQALSSRFEQHITKVKAYANSQLMDD